MCCEYEARLLFCQNFFQLPLSEFSGLAPEKLYSKWLESRNISQLYSEGGVKGV